MLVWIMNGIKILYNKTHLDLCKISLTLCIIVPMVVFVHVCCLLLLFVCFCLFQHICHRICLPVFCCCAIFTNKKRMIKSNDLRLGKKKKNYDVFILNSFGINYLV